MNLQSAALVEALREHFRKTFGHVLHNDESGLKIRRNLRQEKLQRVGTAGGNADGNHAARRQRGAMRFCRRHRLFANDGGRELAAGSAFCDLDFGDQLVGDLFEVSRGGIFGLGKKIDGAQGEGLERGVTALFRMRAEKNDRQGRPAHDEAKRLDSVHARHFEIERNDVVPQLLNLFHRESTAGTFKMRTTVPSPRMEAPLTRSLETISPGSALITNSSSPTRLSTRRPKRFSAAPMTITKFFFLAG